VLGAFLPAQPADVADEGGTVRQGGGDGEGLEVEEVLVGDEDFVAVGFEVPLGDEVGGVENNSISKNTVSFCEKYDNRRKGFLLMLHHRIS